MCIHTMLNSCIASKDHACGARSLYVNLLCHQMFGRPRDMTSVLTPPHTWIVIDNARSNRRQRPQHHQILRPPQKMTVMLTPPHTWNLQQSQPATSPNIAPATRSDIRPSSQMKRNNNDNARRRGPKKSASPTSRNIASATKNDVHLSSYSQTKCQWQHAEQQKSASNITKYCACHVVLISRMGPKIREQFRRMENRIDHDPTMIREWSGIKWTSATPARLGTTGMNMYELYTYRCVVLMRLLLGVSVCRPNHTPSLCIFEVFPRIRAMALWRHYCEGLCCVRLFNFCWNLHLVLHAHQKRATTSQDMEVPNLARISGQYFSKEIFALQEARETPRINFCLEWLGVNSSLHAEPCPEFRPSALCKYEVHPMRQNSWHHTPLFHALEGIMWYTRARINVSVSS